MRNIFATTVLTLALLAAPTLASADTLTDLQARIDSLLAQIKTLQAQIGTTNSTPTSAAISASPVLCLVIQSNLSLDGTDGATNGDVTKLQTFLAQDPSLYPEGRITGYFGPATERAVQRWQARNGIVSSGDADSTGYGFIGPRTRAALAEGCTTDESPLGVAIQRTLSATPTSGIAPLVVQFNIQGLNLSGTTTSTYTLDFGDSSAPYITTSVGKDLVIHTYNQSGTYIAALRKTPGAVKDVDLIGTVTITVTGSSNVRPIITSITPTEGGAGAFIVVYGNGFNAKGSPIIEFLKNGTISGSLNSISYISLDGAKLHFSLSPIFVANSTPGLYQIRYSNSGVVSNAVNFTISSASLYAVSASQGLIPLTVQFTTTLGRGDGIE